MKQKEYDNRALQMAYHDLRPTELINKSPPKFGKLLGLGLNLCIQKERPRECELDASITRFKRDICLKYTFADCPSHDKCHKKIYIKSTWQPNKASNGVENNISEFGQGLQKERMIARLRPKATNLSKYQCACLQHLCRDTIIIVLMTDKNLGPVVMKRCTYIQDMLREHLLDDKGAYQRINESTAYSCMRAVHIRICKLVNDAVSGHDTIYFNRKLTGSDVEDFCLPIMYGMPKLHKNKVPCPFRPVISQCGSFLGVDSVWLDYILAPLIKFVGCYIKDSSDVINLLNEISPVPPGCRIFTSDATAMYPNIDT